MPQAHALQPKEIMQILMDVREWSLGLSTKIHKCK